MGTLSSGRTPEDPLFSTPSVASIVSPLVEAKMDDDHQQEEFLLKWNDHHNSFFSIVQDLCASELLTDVTLACGAGEPIIFEAHKLMLSVCSSFFRNILTRKRADRYQSHPIVFLKDV